MLTRREGVKRLPPIAAHLIERSARAVAEAARGAKRAAPSPSASCLHCKALDEIALDVPATATLHQTASAFATAKVADHSVLDALFELGTEASQDELAYRFRRSSGSASMYCDTGVARLRSVSVCFAFRDRHACFAPLSDVVKGKLPAPTATPIDARPTPTPVEPALPQPSEDVSAITLEVSHDPVATCGG